MLERVKGWARTIGRDIAALYLAGRDPRTPWLAKAVALSVAVYALSPIDLIPDFIPVLGYLDDLLIVPLGIMLAVSLMPAGLMAEFRRAASERGWLPAQRAGAVVIVSIWIATVIGGACWLLA